MKKNLLLVFVFVSTFGFSQCVLKRITETSQSVLVEHFFFRNCINGVIGTESFDVGQSSNFGNVDFYNIQNGIELNNYFYLGSALGGTNQIYSTNFSGLFCNGNYSFTAGGNFSTNGLVYAHYDNSTSSYITFPIGQVGIQQANVDANNDNDNNVDLLYSNVSLPKTMIDGSQISTNIWAVIDPRDGTDFATGFGWSYPPLVFKFNGVTWELQNSFWTGVNNPNTPDLCNSLSISEIKNSKSSIFIYPNPTNNFITIQDKQNLTDNFEYKIVDLTGRIVKSSNSKFNEQINIEHLTSGNYIIQIQTDSNQNFTQKIIKN
jgi:hypothetical protein